ncbi:hypothetical protein [Bifidobacterium scaligerum]|nr:hypothetical protein [Bifidobacterium scaligerum]
MAEDDWWQLWGEDVAVCGSAAVIDVIDVIDVLVGVGVVQRRKAGG